MESLNHGLICMNAISNKPERNIRYSQKEIRELYFRILKEEALIHLKDTRNEEVVNIRCILMKLTKEKTNFSLKQIGYIFGGLHHATIIHNLKRYENLLQTEDEEFLNWVKLVKEYFNGYR